MPINIETGELYSKKQYNKLKKAKLNEKKKLEKLRKKELEHQRILKEKLDNALTIEEDEKLDNAIRVNVNDILNGKNKHKLLGKRVELQGFVHWFKKQGGLMFVDLRDGTGIPPKLQCIFSGDLVKTKDERTLLNQI